MIKKIIHKIKPQVGIYFIFFGPFEDFDVENRPQITNQISYWEVKILIGLLKAIDVIELPFNPHEKLSGKVIDLRKKIYNVETKLRAD